MENKFKINFRQPKYVLPLVTYPFVMGTLYLICDLFTTEIGKPGNSSLKTTEYLNSDLPAANVKKGLGNKRSNMQDTYGNISDFTAVDGFGKEEFEKETYDSKYSDEEAKKVQEEALRLQQEAEAAKKAAELEKSKKEAERERRRNLADKPAGSVFDNDENLAKLSPEDRKRLDELRANRRGRVSSSDPGQADMSEVSQADARSQSSSASSTVKGRKRKDVQELDDDDRSRTVTKKTTEESVYFNTISSNQKESNLIKAIIDENIKASDGSRVRLRLLDDVEVEGVSLKKGTYLYATMSGFSTQRARGKVESVLVDDELVKVSLTIYDLDGLEGLFIPESSFRETVQNVAGDAAGQTMNISNSGTGSMAQWVQQATQNAYQKVSQTISKAIKKKKVKLKYGTHVYLINGKPQKKRK